VVDASSGLVALSPTWQDHATLGHPHTIRKLPDSRDGLIRYLRSPPTPSSNRLVPLRPLVSAP